MNFTIEKANIDDLGIESELRHLIKEAFNSSTLFPARHLINSIQNNASRPGFFLVANANGKIIGCNGFIANDFNLNGLSYVGYQSCWSATDPDHRGKGVFTGIINEAKKLLKESGAGFLYGIPNNDSLPLFVNKLDFVETPSLVTRIPNIPFFRKYYFTKRSVAKTNACTIDEAQVAAHKSALNPDAIKTIRYNDSWLWGKVLRKKKIGITVPVFYVGGMNLADESDLMPICIQLFREQNVLFIQLVSCKTNSLNVLVKGWRRANLNGFIFYNLNMPSIEHFNIMFGAIDVF